MDGFNKSDYPLNEIFIKEWEGFIFICMSGKAEYFDIFYKPIKNKFNGWQLLELDIVEKRLSN